MLCGYTTLWATNYYVDFDNGNDSLAGTSPALAWKHTPGDVNAKVVPITTPIVGGDTILFKGGVHYRGNVIITKEGLPGKPIVYKGDGWGTGKAIMDGSEPLTNWTQCAAAAECGGNPNWQHIYHTTTPLVPATLRSGIGLAANLYQDDQMVPVSQEPDMPDPLFMDNLSYYQTAAGMTATTATATWFRTLGGAGLVGSYIFAWRSVNEVDFRKISAFDSTANRVTFQELAEAPYTEASRWLVSVANSPLGSILDHAGEYYLNETAVTTGIYTVYLWPFNNQAPNTADISISVRNRCFDVARSHITIEGFVIQKYSGLDYGTAYAVGKLTDAVVKSHITVQHNDIIRNRCVFVYDAIVLVKADSSLVEHNYFNQNARLRGVEFVDSYWSAVRENTFDRIGRTAVCLTGCSYSRAVGNYIKDCTGVHSNGISAYSSNTRGLVDNILIANNTVINSNIPITTQGAKNIYIFDNVLWAGANQAIAVWNLSATSDSGLYIIHNTIPQSSDEYGMLYYSKWGNYYR
jgi:hypothetical protein